MKHKINFSTCIKLRGIHCIKDTEFDFWRNGNLKKDQNSQIDPKFFIRRLHYWKPIRSIYVVVLYSVLFAIKNLVFVFNKL